MSKWITNELPKNEEPVLGWTVLPDVPKEILND